MRRTTVDRTSTCGLRAAPQWIEHYQVVYAQRHSGPNISKCSLRSTTVDRTSPSAQCAAPQWIEHLQLLYVQHRHG